MTDLRTAAQQALAFTMRDFASLRDFEAAKAVLYDILRAALAQPEPEPVAWRFQSAVGGWAYGSQPPLGSKYPAYPLYTAPQQRKPLTDEDIDRIDACIDKFTPLREGKRLFARAVERAHGIKE
jgi:hypothetical protein